MKVASFYNNFYYLCKQKLKIEDYAYIEAHY